MRPADYARLLALAAIWGGSFIFQRVASPVLGAALTAEGRLLIAGLVLALWFRFTGFDPQWRRYGRQYAAIGIVNMALPSLLYAFALVYIPAALAAILNSTSPIFGALFAALFLGEPFSKRKALGCAAGALGVALVAQPDEFASTPMFGIAVAACLAALPVLRLHGCRDPALRRTNAFARHRGRQPARRRGVAAAPAAVLAPGRRTDRVRRFKPCRTGAAGQRVRHGALLPPDRRRRRDAGTDRHLPDACGSPLLWGALFLGEALPASRWPALF